MDFRKVLKAGCVYRLKAQRLTRSFQNALLQIQIQQWCSFSLFSVFL